MMFLRLAVLFLAMSLVASCSRKEPLFNIEKDLLLAHYDCKTDVDDLHSVAALATLLQQPAYQNINFHAVAGAYGTQDGLYVPPNALFETAFATKWSDAHDNWEIALQEVYEIARKTLDAGGDIWIPEAGQSDFSAALVRRLNEADQRIDTKNRVHIVQHSDWNEEVTSPDALSYVQTTTDYHKIPDGNAADNGSPDFRDDAVVNWQAHIQNEHLADIWTLAQEIANLYNGKDGRYLNESIAAGGLDFSDFSEVCFIFGLQDLKDAEAFFENFATE